MSYDVWAGTSLAMRDPEDPEVVTVDFALLDGAEILDAQVVGGSILSLRLRVPREVEDRARVDS